MSIKLCQKPISGRSRFESLIKRRCFREHGHNGKCSEFPYLSDLAENYPRVEAKIKRDATKTTGAAWKSDDAGPNRIDRWAMLLPDNVLKDDYSIDMANMKPAVQAKLREKAATYDQCMEVAASLAWSTYQMKNAPTAPDGVKSYLERRFGKFEESHTKCIVCRGTLDFEDFARAQRGRAHIETAHANPRSHNAENVGFAHRECNIAQGGLTLSEFYDWIRQVLNRVEAEGQSSTSAPKA
jgi:hypothetical protein